MPLIDLGPITLECLCEGGALAPCTITDLDFVVEDFENTLFGFAFDVTGGLGGTFTVLGGGITGLSPIADWLVAMEGLGITLNFGRSTSSDTLETGSASFFIRATYLCIDSNGHPSTEYVDSQYRGGGDAECPDNGRGFVAGSSVFASWWHSRPLSDCTGISIPTSGGFTAPDAGAIKSGQSSGDWCLCPSGGTGFLDDDGNELAPILHFTIVSGVLPSGQRLDPETGCILGTPDGVDPGTDTITFRVLDGRSEEGAYADVTCGVILPGCTGPTELPEGNYFIS